MSCLTAAVHVALGRLCHAVKEACLDPGLTGTSRACWQAKSLKKARLKVFIGWSEKLPGKYSIHLNTCVYVHYLRLPLYTSPQVVFALILPGQNMKQFFSFLFFQTLRPSSDAILTLKESLCKIGQKRWNEATSLSGKMVLNLSKSVSKWLRYRRFKTGP